MRIAISLSGYSVLTRYEPVENADWESSEVSSIEDREDEFWITFFTVHPRSAVRFVDALELALEEVGEEFHVETIGASRYCYVLAYAISSDFYKQSPTEKAAWMACMRVAARFSDQGCTLFSAEKFLAFDRARASALLLRGCKIDISTLAK
jgi:hypothetical protein